jgi:hypothetical protein
LKDFKEAYDANVKVCSFCLFRCCSHSQKASKKLKAAVEVGPLVNIFFNLPPFRRWRIRICSLKSWSETYSDPLSPGLLTAQREEVVEPEEAGEVMEEGTDDDDEVEQEEVSKEAAKDSEEDVNIYSTAFFLIHARHLRKCQS